MLVPICLFSSKREPSWVFHAIALYSWSLPNGGISNASTKRRVNERVRWILSFTMYFNILLIEPWEFYSSKHPRGLLLRKYQVNVTSSAFYWNSHDFLIPTRSSEWKIVLALDWVGSSRNWRKFNWKKNILPLPFSHCFFSSIVSSQV